MAGQALRRLMAEYKRECNLISNRLVENFRFENISSSMFMFFDSNFSELSINAPEGIIAGPISEENFFEWEALISGPADTIFEGGLFPAKLVFPTGKKD